MQAYVRISPQHGDVEVAEVPVPEIGADEVLVAVRAFGVGIHDRYFIPHDARFPYPIGSEGAGTVERIGANVTDVAVGDRVVFSSSMQPKGGCWAEYVAIRHQALVPLPAELEFAKGAALPVAGKTALESIRALDLEADQTLFVAGGSGAVGTFVIQLAAAQGVRVAASSSPRNHDYLRALGADMAVDYADPAWPAQVREWAPGGVDAALAIQPGTAAACMEAVKDGGLVITVSGDQVRPRPGVLVRQFQHRLDFRQAVGTLASDIATGRIRAVIAHVYPFGEALDALRQTETRHARGKLVVSLDSAG